MSDVAALSAIGIAIAVVVSLPLGRLVESQLFGLTGRDPVVICIATIVLAGTALVSGYIPALRATRVDPMAALRWD